MPPEDPRQGNPNHLSTWIGLGGLTIIIIVIGTTTIWNRIGGDSPTPSPTTTPRAGQLTSPTSSASAVQPAEKVYRIIFEGTASADAERPNQGQRFGRRNGTVTWHFEYTLGDGHSTLREESTSRISGHGKATNWDGASCTATQPLVKPSASALRAEGGIKYSIIAPPGDGVYSAVCGQSQAVDPISSMWAIPYCADSSDAACLKKADRFWFADFTIPAGQTGSHTITIDPRSYTNRVPLGTDVETDQATWHGSVTVIAQ